MNVSSPDSVDTTLFQSNWTFSSVWEAVWRIENALNLFERQVAGIYYWLLLRGRLFDLLCHRFGLLHQMQSPLRRSFFRRVAYGLAPLASDLTIHPWSLDGPFDSILLPFPRKYVFNGEVVDIYSHRLLGDPAAGRILILDGVRRQNPKQYNKELRCNYGERPNSRPSRMASKRVVVMSQGTVGERLFEMTIAAAHAAPGWSFVFRPHPWEDFEEYKSRFASLAVSPANMSISERSENSYDLLGSAEVQAGVYSTSMYEGMMLGARTIVAALPGCEHMASVINKGDAAPAKSGMEIAEQLESAPLAKDPSYYYAKPIPSLAAIL